MSKIKYNKNSAHKLGWKPEWFGHTAFDKVLVQKIAKWQKRKGLTSDGLCGSGTYRRILTERIQNIDDYEPDLIPGKDESFIVHMGNFIPIEWDKVVLWSEDNGLKLEKGFTPYTKKREINMFMNHWDVCLNSKTCNRVLQKRGISVHFLLDNDGTIYQTMDMNDIAWHAGNSNDYSIGVEISNAYYIDKYDDWYIRNGLGKRPRWTGTVRGQELEEHLGFYDVQIEACQALWKAVANACDIPLRCPLENGTMVDKLYSPALNGWEGFVHHFHVSNKKIDCGGFDLKKYLGR
jgi:hypothetical protein